MAYRILYGTDILWEPYSDNTDAITDATMSVNVNAAKYLDFTMPPTHSLYNVIAERDKLIRLYANDKLIYKGYITKITLDMEGYKQVNCSSVMSYLGDTHVRDYSTIEGEQPLKAPTSLDGLFQWYIDQHNKHCMDSNKRFIVGVNQAGALDENNYVYRSSTQFPTTSSEIEEKILNLGGYIFERYEDDNNILDFYADAHEANTQILDFGVNITDFTHERSGEDQYTAIYATGYTPDPPEDDPEKKMRPISLADIQNGGSPYSADLFKLGDVLYSISGVQRYGYREYYYSNDDITTTDYLLKAAGVVLTKLLAPTITLEVKAVDMALFMENGYEHLQLGQAVRVRSKPRNIDEYLMISGIDLDLQDPGHTSYTIGATYDTLTGQQSSYLKSLNSGINSSLDSVAALDKATKENAKGIDEAKKDAANATSKANEASNKADVATNTANNANTKANEAKADAANANTKSDTATETANSASQNAQKAQEAAAAATSNAKDAVTAAGKATEIANSANTKSEQATDLANSANQAASTASSIASEAKKTAENAKAAAEEGVAAAKDAASKAQVAADKAQADANANTKAVAQAQSAADAAKKAAADAQEKAENVESNLESANAVIEQHSNKLGELSTKVSNAVTNADAALTASTEAKQTATEASTMANTAYEDSQTAITNSTKATQTATEAKTTAESAVTTANDSLKQSSSAVQTANRIQNTLTTDYQTKADSDLLYATKSSLTETSESIKMEVSANYATKSTVEALKNVADNAIESWRGSGVPTSENKPASDWTTTEEKKRHSGDLYYDKDTGKAYRWGSDDGIVYSWVLNQDTDITKALQDASNAQKSADNAQTTANGAVTAAGNAQKSADGAQSTANSAKTAAANAQKTADTVQTDVDQLKIDIPNTYATKASLETTANSITAQVESVSTTANSAVTAASKAQQTADAINVNLTKNYQTKENADNTYATKATLTATSESLSTSITKAQQTADGAVNAASNAQQTADAININLSKNYQTAKDADDKYATQTSLNATAESIRSEVSTTYATKTDVTDAVDGLANTVETTYSTKSEVKQLSDQVSSTVTEVSTVKNDLSAAKKVADDAALAASKAQQTANDAKTDAATAQSAADTAKANAAAAQSKADEAANNLAAAEENLNNLQSQADATDEQVASAQTAVENAKKAADAAQADATTAKNAAATAQSIANTAKANAATAQSTADTAKANAKTAQDDVNALKNRVTTAETSIKQNSDAIALRATKTEVTSAIDGISVGGRNLLLGTAAFNVTDISNMDDEKNGLNNSDLFRGNRVLKYNKAWYRYYILASKFVKKYNLKGGEFVTYSIWFKFTTNDLKDTDSKVFNVNGYNGASKSENFYTKIATLNVVTDADVWRQYSFSFKIPEDISEADNQIRIEIDYFTEPDYTSPRLTQWWSSPKLEFGNKATDWSPAPEDLVAESKTYTDAQMKITSDSITSTVSKTYATKTDLAENYTTTVDMNSKIEQTANSIKSEVSEVYQPKGDYAIKSEVDQTIEGVETKITTVTNTANAAQTATNTLNTLIRQSGNGVEVAKKVNGAYTSTKTLMGSDGFYVKDDSGNNLTQIKPSQAIIGKAESKNVLVNSNGINIRNGENTIASFSEDIVELGKNSKNSVINMCNKNGSIEVVADDGGDYGENFTITGKSGAAIRYQALMEDPYHEGYYIPYEKAEVYTNKRVGNSHVKEAGMYVFDKTYGHASMRVLVNEPIYGNNCASIGADNIYLTADKSVTINGSGILNVKKSLYIQDNIVSDFVVAEGKCDFWTYRMWNSGIAECWGHTSQTTVSVTSEWGYLYDSGTGHTNGFPGNTTESSALKFNVTIGGVKCTKLFTSVEHCDCNFISSDNAFIIEIGSGLTNLQTPQVFLLRPTSADVTGKFSYHAIGRWKA